MTSRINTLVFSGGANRGIMFGGALLSLEKHGVLKNISTYVGTSVGALMAGLCAVGYTAKELYTIIMNTNIGDVKPNNELELYNIFNNFGCYSSTKMLALVRQLIAKKAELGDITFQQLKEVFETKLVVTTCCVNTSTTEYLCCETMPDLSIVRGICMSMTIPIMFEPFLMEDFMYVDGGMFGHSYPIQYVFEHKTELETIGLQLHNTYQPPYVNTIAQFVTALMNGFMRMRTGLSIRNTINLVCDIGLLDDFVSRAQKQTLIDSGFQQTERVIKQFI